MIPEPMFSQPSVLVKLDHTTEAQLSADFLEKFFIQVLHHRKDFSNYLVDSELGVKG